MGEPDFSVPLHYWFQELNKCGVWEALWMLVADLAKAAGKVDETKAFLDGNITKAPLGGDTTGPSPVHRRRLGSKRSVMTDGEGYPIFIVLGPANRHDSKMLAETLAARILFPLKGTYLVVDKGYRGRPAEAVCLAAGFTRVLPPPRSDRKDGEPRSPVDPRQLGRWKVERTFAWLHAFRGLEQRLERQAVNHMGLLHLWAAIVWWRRIATSTGG